MTRACGTVTPAPVIFYFIHQTFVSYTSYAFFYYPAYPAGARSSTSWISVLPLLLTICSYGFSRVLLGHLPFTGHS